MKMKLTVIAGALFCLLAWSQSAYCDTITLNFSGTQVNVVGEYINAVKVASPQFAPSFSNAQTIQISIAYDTGQADTDSDSDILTFRIGSLSISIPELGLSASRNGTSMQISSFNNVQNIPPQDQFFAYANGVNSFSNSVLLPNPESFSALFFGDTSMVPADLIPTDSLNWTSGNASFNFTATDGTTRQVLLSFQPVPEPSLMLLLGIGLGAVTIAGWRRK
jgi:hypothetical protein